MKNIYLCIVGALSFFLLSCEGSQTDIADMGTDNRPAIYEDQVYNIENNAGVENLLRVMFKDNELALESFSLEEVSEKSVDYSQAIRGKFIKGERVVSFLIPLTSPNGLSNRRYTLEVSSGWGCEGCMHSCITTFSGGCHCIFSGNCSSWTP